MYLPACNLNYCSTASIEDIHSRTIEPSVTLVTDPL